MPGECRFWLTDAANRIRMSLSVPDRYPEQTRFHMASAHAPTTDQDAFQIALRKRLKLAGVKKKKHFTADVKTRTKSILDHFDAYLNYYIPYIPTLPPPRTILLNLALPLILYTV